MKNIEIRIKLWDVKIIHNFNFHVDNVLHFFFFWGGMLCSHYQAELRRQRMYDEKKPKTLSGSL